MKSQPAHLDDIRIRTATRDDLLEWYGENWQKTCRAWVIEKDGKAAAIAGYSMEGTYALMFSSIGPDHGASKLTIWRYARKIFEMAKGYKVPLMAVACPKTPGSARFLERLGFVYVKTCDAGELYKWQP